MKNKGYTIPELIIVIAGLGIVFLITIIRTSYAFSNDSNKEVLESNYYLIEKQAEVYGEINKDKFNEGGELYILAKDLVKEGLLPLDENNNILSSKKDLSNTKIKIILKENKITAQVIK